MFVYMKEAHAIKWLNSSQKYEDGIRVLRQIGVDEKEIAQIELSKERCKALFYRIKNLLPNPKTRTTVHRPSTPKTPKNLEPILPYSQEPVAIAAKREADILFKDMMNKRALLFQMCTVKESPFENEMVQVNKRKKLTTEIIHLDRKVKEAYNKYRFTAEKGYVPETKISTRKGTPHLLLYKQIKNKRTYISKLQKKENLSSKQMVLLEKHESDLSQLLKEYEYELSQL